MTDSTRESDSDPDPSPPGALAPSTFGATPAVERAYLVVCAGAAMALPLWLHDLGPAGHEDPLLTLTALVVASALNVEIGRALSGGLERTQQPHKALSAWAFCCALLLPPPMLLVVVPLTYAHARWRGLRVPLWKWVGSGCFVVLAGMAAVGARVGLLGDRTNWMQGDGGAGVLAIAAAALAFLAVEALLFLGTAYLNHAEDEVWLRRTLRSPSFYGTEAAVLLIGGLLAAVWTGGPWFVLFFVPVYALLQRAALHEPLRERARAAAQLVTKNQQLELANRFKIDLVAMVGHEIGNPLTSVQGYAEVALEALADDDLDSARTAIAVVERNASHIRTVLHEILTLVGSDGGALIARPEPCLLTPRLEIAAAGQPPGRQPVVDCPADLHALVQPSHLDQILANLLGNATKYAGGATRLSARAATDSTVEILVEDAGPGIPAEFKDHLFERFSRHDETASSVPGMGLGLFITLELVRANHGTIGYRDADPTGAIFVVTLPA